MSANGLAALQPELRVVRSRGWRNPGVRGLVVLLTCVVVGCGGESGPTGPSGRSSYLTGMWRGTLTVNTTRRGDPDISGPVTWSFSPAPGAGGQAFDLRIESQNPWLSFSSTTVAVIGSPDPPAEISVSGTYASPRGCRGDFVFTGEAQARTIDAEVAGIDCPPAPGQPVQGFIGRIRLTKQ